MRIFRFHSYKKSSKLFRKRKTLHGCCKICLEFPHIPGYCEDTREQATVKREDGPWDEPPAALDL